MQGSQEAWNKIDRIFTEASKQEAKRIDAKEKKRLKMIAGQEAYKQRLIAMGKYPK